MIDGKGIDLLGDYDNHLHLPDDLVKICKHFRLPDMCYFQVQPADLPRDHAIQDKVYRRHWHFLRSDVRRDLGYA